MDRAIELAQAVRRLFESEEKLIDASLRFQWGGNFQDNTREGHKNRLACQHRRREAVREVRRLVEEIDPPILTPIRDQYR
jgi:hypothetical protein